MRTFQERLLEFALRTVWPAPAWRLRYALAVASTVAVAGLKLAIPAFGERGPDLFLTIPVAISAVVAGFGPALLADLGATVVAAYFIPPASEFRLITRLDIVEILGFFVEGLVIAVLGAGLRTALLQTVESLRHLEELQRERAALFATVNHELRNPLTVLSAQLELAGRYAARDDARRRVPDALGAARGQVSRLLRLTEDLLVLSTSTAPSFRIEAQPVELADAIGAAARRGQAFARSHTIRTVPPAEPLAVRADPARLDQILDNLISNAVRYSPAGSTVELEAARAESGGFGVIRVRDEGPGIPAHERARIFDRFARGESWNGVSGSGIGLYVSRELATRMGGRIVLSESSERGTVFAVELPLAPPQEAEAADVMAAGAD